MGILKRSNTVACASPTLAASDDTVHAENMRRRRWVLRADRNTVIEMSDAKGGSMSSESPPKPSVRNPLVMFKTIWNEYCKSTAIHGVRFFVEDGRSAFERMFWGFALAMSFVGCFYSIYQVYMKWDQSPVMVSFADTTTPICQVPFPAVSICPEIKSRQSVFNFTQNFYRIQDANKTHAPNETSDMSDDELNTYEAVSLLCNQHLAFPGLRKLAPPDAIRTLYEVVPPITEAVWVCSWRGQMSMNCTPSDQPPLFRPFMSEEGVCYTFNMLDNMDLFTRHAVQFEMEREIEEKVEVHHPESGEHYLDERPWEPLPKQPGASRTRTQRRAVNWTLEDGYVNGSPWDTYPRRGEGFDDRSGLHILLSAHDEDFDYLCLGPVQGYKVLLHNPAETPRRGQQYVRVSNKQDVVLVVRPVMTTTPKHLRGYDSSRRLCYFQDERLLRFYKVYTQRNCELERRTNVTIAMCGCVAFYMPRPRNVSICGPGSFKCMKDATDMVKRDIAVLDDQRLREDGLHRKVNMKYSYPCLRACTSLDYDIHNSLAANYDWKAVYEAHRENTSGDGKDFALGRLSIFFGDTQFLTSHRSEVFGPTRFLAECGGLLGLFSGFSLISLIEILYFLSIRLWCKVRRSDAMIAAVTTESEPGQQQTCEGLQ